MRNGILVMVVAALLATGCDRLVERQIERQVSRAEVDLLKSKDMHVVLCGTGSPIADASRAGACTAIVAGGELVLVDIGPGSWEVADLANLPTAALSAILLTHFHSDHIGDLGEAVTQSWIAGRAKPLDVYGPPGVDRVVGGFREAYTFDVDYRVAHHGEKNLPRAAAHAVPHPIPLPSDPMAAVPVFERNGLRVSMFAVDHRPVEPAVGYRFEYGNRAVVISGDTARSASLEHNAAGADLLIHEALQRDMIKRAADTMGRLGRNRMHDMAGDILNYHASPVDAAATAKAAGVKHLVLTHMVPAPNNFLTRRMFLAGVSDAYDGEVTVGADGERFTLAAKGGS